MARSTEENAKDSQIAIEDAQNGIPVPKEGTPEFAELNRMAKVAIPIVLSMYTLGVFMQQAFGMIYVNIGKQLDSPQLASLITSIPGIVLGITSVVYGALGDFVSLRKMMILGTIVFVLGSAVGCLGMAGIWLVILGRALQTAGWQSSGTVFLVLVSKYVKGRDRVIWYGVFVAVFRFAAALGVFLAGYMTLFDWRVLFAIGILELPFLPLLRKNLPDYEAVGTSMDSIGFVLIGVLAGSVTMYFTDYKIIWLVFSVVSLIILSRHIRTSEHPFISQRMLTHAPFVLITIMTFIVYLFSYTITPGVNAIGLNVYGMDSSQVSNLLVWSILLAAIMGFGAGPIIRKIGRAASIVMAAVFMTAGLFLVAAWIPWGPMWSLGVAPCFYYFGTSFLYQPIVDTTGITVEPEETGRALGVNGMVQAISGSVGVALFGGIMASGSMSAGSILGSSTGAISTYANVFILGALAIMLSLVFFLLACRHIYKGLHQ